MSMLRFWILFYFCLIFQSTITETIANSTYFQKKALNDSEIWYEYWIRIENGGVEVPYYIVIEEAEHLKQIIDAFLQTVLPVHAALDEVSRNLQNGILEGKQLQMKLCDSRSAYSENTDTIILLPNVPRSGTGWIRSLLRESIPTATPTAVYLEDHNDDTNRESKSKEGPLHSTLLLKTHYPFLPLCQHPPYLKEIEKLIVLRMIRNPFSNFIALSNYDQFGSYPSTFKGFMVLWSSHHQYWDSVTADSMSILIPYENLCQETSRVMHIIKEIMQRHFQIQISDVDIAQALNKFDSKKKNINHSLQSDLRKVGVEDVQWAFENHREILIKHEMHYLLCNVYEFDCSSAVKLNDFLYEQLPKKLIANNRLHTDL